MEMLSSRDMQWEINAKNKNPNLYIQRVALEERTKLSSGGVTYSKSMPSLLLGLFSWKNSPRSFLSGVFGLTQRNINKIPIPARIVIPPRIYIRIVSMLNVEPLHYFLFN